MKGDALTIIAIIGTIFVVGTFVYHFFAQREEVKIEYSYVPSIPKYSNLIFSPLSPTPGEFPIRYLDLERDDYLQFRYSIKSSFMEKTNVRICPYITYTLPKDEVKTIRGECQDVLLQPNEEKTGDITISLVNEKEEMKNSLKIFVVVNVTYSSNLRGVCDLCIESGYPTCVVSKNSEIKVTPILSPNPIKLDRDELFSIDLGVERYSESLAINRIEVKPLETRVIRRQGNRRIEETITIDGECKLEKEIYIKKPQDNLRICNLPQPKIKVKEEIGNNTALQYFQLNCESEAAKKLKICEVLEKEKRTDILKQLPIFINISFSASKSYSYRLFLTS